MKKTIFLHIGAHKTGTTAIQLFLSKNRELLKKDGFLYPGHDYAHHEMVAEFNRNSMEDITENQTLFTHQIMDEIHKSNVNNIIISSENFEYLENEIKNLKCFFLPNFFVKIIYYIRRQDELIESWYNASVKNPRIRSTSKFSEFFLPFEKGENFFVTGGGDAFSNIKLLDYYAVLSPWKEAFGGENILVRCYEEEQLPEGIFYDFLGTLGLSLKEEYQLPPAKVNEGLRWDLLEIIRICNKNLEIDFQFHMFLLDYFSKIKRKQIKEERNFLSPIQKLKILSHFKESNEKVACEFLHRADKRLFFSSFPNPNDPWEPIEDLDVEDIIPIFITSLQFQFDSQKNENVAKQKYENYYYNIEKKISTLDKKLMDLQKKYQENSWNGGEKFYHPSIKELYQVITSTVQSLTTSSRKRQ